MNIERDTTIRVTLSPGDIIRALRSLPPPTDFYIHALPITGNGVVIEAVGSHAVRLTYIHKGPEA